MKKICKLFGGYRVIVSIFKVHEIRSMKPNMEEMLLKYKVLGLLGHMAQEYSHQTLFLATGKIEVHREPQNKLKMKEIKPFSTMCNKPIRLKKKKKLVRKRWGSFPRKS